MRDPETIHDASKAPEVPTKHGFVKLINSVPVRGVQPTQDPVRANESSLFQLERVVELDSRMQRWARVGFVLWGSMTL